MSDTNTEAPTKLAVYHVQPETDRDTMQRPYPFDVRSDNFRVLGQDLWQGDPYTLIGFVGDFDRQDVDVIASEAHLDTEAGRAAVAGMYLVTANRFGSFSSWGHPIELVTRFEFGPETLEKMA